MDGKNFWDPEKLKSPEGVLEDIFLKAASDRMLAFCANNLSIVDQFEGRGNTFNHHLKELKKERFKLRFKVVQTDSNI